MKRETITQRIINYYENHPEAELFSERIDIGKVILRILEKL